MDRDPQLLRGLQHPVIVGGEARLLAQPPQENDRRDVERVEGPQGDRERLERALQHLGHELQEPDPGEGLACRIRMGAGEAASVDTDPDFVLEEPAGDQGFPPQRGRGRSVFGEKVREHYRSVEIDHRSSRSWSSSASRSLRGATGARGGGSSATIIGAEIQPFRITSAISASATSGLRPARGGTISATTRSRSVTSTVSPRAARRTYSLSLFLRTLSPTAYTNLK